MIKLVITEDLLVVLQLAASQIQTINMFIDSGTENQGVIVETLSEFNHKPDLSAHC